MNELGDTNLFYPSWADQLPPDTFNYSERVFRPTDSYEIDENLQDRVRELMSQTRYRSALDEVLKVLDEKPDDYFALRMAIIVLKLGRDTYLRADEPITLAQRLDSRLDPIFAVCSRCKSISWVPLEPAMLLYGQVQVSNPAGLQCYKCGYVVCRDCYVVNRSSVEFAFISQVCPNCQEEALAYPVYPTGRPSRQMMRYKEPVTHVILFREGPIVPDQAYIESVLEIASPDALQGGVTLTGVPLPQWPDDPKKLMEAYVIRYQIERKLKVGFSNVEFADLVRDQWGNRGYISKLIVPSKLAEDIVDFLERTIERMIQLNEANPMITSSELEWRLLLDPEILRYIQIDIANCIEVSTQENEHKLYVRKSDEIIWLLSVIPNLAVAEIKQYFQPSYLDYLQRQIDYYNLGSQITKSNIAHIIFCHEGDKYNLHTTFLPKSKETIAILPIDLLNQQEKEHLNLSVEPDDTYHNLDSPGGLFWFDWEAISDAGHSFYGRYVYQSMLPIFAKILPEFPFASHVFFDGDCLNDDSIDLPVRGEVESEVAKNIVQLGVDRCYVIAVYGTDAVLEQVHFELAGSDIIGYLGKTSCAGMSFDEFYQLTGKMTLPFAARIQGRLFEKASFDFLSDDQLIELGFVPVDFER